MQCSICHGHDSSHSLQTKKKRLVTTKIYFLPAEALASFPPPSPSTPPSSPHTQHLFLHTEIYTALILLAPDFVVHRREAKHC